MLHKWLHLRQVVRAAQGRDVTAEPGFTLLGQSGGRGRCRPGTCLGKGLQPGSAWRTEGAWKSPPSRSRTLTAPRAKVTEAFEPQGGRPDTMSTAKGLTRRNTAEGATEQPGRSTCGRGEKHQQGGERGQRPQPAHGRSGPAFSPALSSQIDHMQVTRSGPRKQQRPFS